MEKRINSVCITYVKPMYPIVSMCLSNLDFINCIALRTS